MIWQCCVLPNLCYAAVINAKGVDYYGIIHDICKSKAIHLLESFVFHDRGHIQNVYQRNSY